MRLEVDESWRDNVSSGADTRSGPRDPQGAAWSVGGESTRARQGPASILLPMEEVTDRLNAALDGRYRIERHLGAGGMATVYLAQDLKHDRKVAVKVLKPELAAVLGAERFVVEIKTTASLQHPHILPLFDSGSADGFLYYVMPFIEGETLRDKLDRETQLGVEDAVRITREVADALDYAHRRGVIHRDIKPENVLLHDGRPMVADFGIALAVSAAAGGRMTETGLSLGTPHYMSPEQATADKEITARSDIYSLASVLYEMLTGNPPHTGASAQQIIMRIITDAPRPVTELRRSVPANVAAAVSRALEKLPADRFASAKEFAEALHTTGFTHAGSTSLATVSVDRRRSWATAAAWATAGVMAVVAAAGWMRRPPDAQPIRLDIDVGDLVVALRDIVLSPDGSMIAIAATRGGEQAIWVRRLHGDGEFQKVPGTEGGIYPSFSPDNQWIVFRRRAARTVVKVRVMGGNAVTLLDAGSIDPYSPHWGTESDIVFSAPQGNFRLSASGGTPELLNQVQGRTPYLLPDGSGVLFSRSGVLSFYEFSSDSAWEVGAIGLHPVLVESRYLVYVSERGSLVASRFDPASRRTIGEPLQLAEQAASTSNARAFSISRNGSLVLVGGLPTSGLGESGTRLLLGTIGGSLDTLRLPPGRRVEPRFSPDGRKLAYRLDATGRLGDGDLYTFDLVDNSNTQLTFGGNNTDPIWSPDGKRLLFSRKSDSTNGDLYVKPADSSAPEQLLLLLPYNQWPTDWPSEDQIALATDTPDGHDLLLWSPGRGGEPTPYLTTPWAEREMSVSPDGKLAAFTSNEAGAREVWIRDFPMPRGKWRASRGASGAPRWSSDGRYLFYTHAGGGSGIDTLYRVLVERKSAVSVSATPEVMFIGDIDGISNWDLHPDGKHFVVAMPENGAGPAATSATTVEAVARYVITLNWVASLERAMRQQAK